MFAALHNIAQKVTVTTIIYNNNSFTQIQEQESIQHIIDDYVLELPYDVLQCSVLGIKLLFLYKQNFHLFYNWIPLKE